jgi:error-prone DNA polymerase
MKRPQRDFVELNAKSCFSFLRAASHPEELVQQAHQLGYRGLAITDINGFYGMVRTHESARQLLFTSLFGVEIRLEGSPLILLAKSFKGYSRLCRMISEAYQNRPKGDPLFTQELVKKWLDPQVMHSLLPANQPTPQNLFSWLREISPLTQLVTQAQHPDQDLPMLRWLNQLPAEIPRAWTWQPLFHHPIRFEAFGTLEAINKKTTIYENPAHFNAQSYLHPLSDLDRLKVPIEWTDETLRIAESCTFSPTEIKYRYPKEWLPDGMSSFEFLSQLCEKGIRKRYPDGPSKNVVDQLSHELQMVRELEFEDYFLTVWDIVHFARSQKILCQGRGSAANSVICYLLEITSIDPVRMNLLFERFISRERNEAPDIDVDFEHERREEVIQYVYRKYGRERAGMVATLLTYRSKSAFRDSGKALGIPTAAIDLVSRKLSWREAPENVVQQIPELELTSAQKDRWIRVAQTIKSFPRHLGQHTGGMILTDGRLDEISPIEPARMEGRSVIQWDKYDIEKLGLLKIDLLGLGMLTCLRKSFDLIRDFYGLDLELHRIPPQDEKTFEMIAQARTVGVFQIESRAQMNMLPRLKPKNFYDLVVEVAIVRPGPLQGGMVHPYLRRRMGLEPVTYAHPKLKPILEKTLGVPIFQEQVMKMAIEVAGYTPGEADALRRAMGAWKKSGNLESHAKAMCQRMVKNGVPQSFAEQVCQQILGFGEYGFPESHAASFALLTYASSYLKAHYPAAFLCGLLNSMPMGFYSHHALHSTFLREGVRILPPHTELSDWDHQLERDEDGSASLRLGFRIIRGVSQKNAMRFISERKLGRFDLSVFDHDEKAQIALATEEFKRRESLWAAIDKSDQTLPLRSSRTKPPQFPTLSKLSSVLLDLEVMETTLKQHPASVLREEAWSYSLRSDQLTMGCDVVHRSNRLVHVFGIIQVIQSPPTAKGLLFITLEDETGFINLVVKPNIYQRHKDIFQTQWGLLVSGRVQNQSGSVSILVQHVHRREERKSEFKVFRRRGHPRDLKQFENYGESISR